MLKLKKERRTRQVKEEDINISEDGMSYHMIAAILNISVQEVKMIELNALRKIKTPTEANRKLRDYLKLNLSQEDKID